MMNKQKIKIPKKRICNTCHNTVTYRKCSIDCKLPKCINCICKCQSIKDLPTKNNKSVTKPIKKSKKRMDQ